MARLPVSWRCSYCPAAVTVWSTTAPAPTHPCRKRSGRVYPLEVVVEVEA